MNVAKIARAAAVRTNAVRRGDGGHSIVDIVFVIAVWVAIEVKGTVRVEFILHAPAALGNRAVGEGGGIAFQAGLNEVGRFEAQISDAPYIVGAATWQMCLLLRHDATIMMKGVRRHVLTDKTEVSNFCLKLDALRRHT